MVSRTLLVVGGRRSREVRKSERGRVIKQLERCLTGNTCQKLEGRAECI